MARYIVCPDCQGEGTHGPGFVYTSEDIDRDFRDVQEFDEHISDIRNGVYDTVCNYCQGRRVVPAITDDGIPADEAWRQEMECAEIRAEQRYFGNY